MDGYKIISKKYNNNELGKDLKNFFGNKIQIHPKNFSSIGIVLMDRIDGPFKFELGFIGVTHDTGHWEISAYETYKHPQFV